MRGNTIWTYGSECFNVKENAHGNLFQGNDCRYNDEPGGFGGSNIELRGHSNTLRRNTIAASRGYNLKMKSDSDALDRGGNSAQDNAFAAAGAEHILNDQAAAQGPFCGNTFSGENVLAGRDLGDPGAPCPSPAPAPVTLQAEAGTVAAPMLVGNDAAASGGRYIVQKSSSGTGTATYSFAITTAGAYRLTGRVIAPNGSANSFLYAVDGGASRTWHLPDNLRRWTWASGPTLNLGAGAHRLVIKKREPNTKLDVVKVQPAG